MMKSTVTMLASASLALGHATWQQLWVDGVDLEGECARLPLSNSPVEDVTSTDLTCNVGGTTAGVSGVCDVPAGSTVTVEMHEQPNDRDCSSDAIGGNHHGPILVYLQAVDDATSADGSGEWFKIAEHGYEDGVWGDQYINDNCGQFDVVIPEALPSGDYLLRAEIIALHTAGSAGGAQFYMTCFQISVTDGGSASVPEGVLLPGDYTADHPGILVDIWGQLDEYEIPGPAVVDL